MAQTAKKPQKDDKHTCILFWLLYNCHKKIYLAPKIAEKNNPAPISAEKNILLWYIYKAPPRISNGPPLICRQIQDDHKNLKMTLVDW